MVFGLTNFKGAVAFYPMTNKATAVIAALTYETNGKKEDFDLTPGDNLSLSWGHQPIVAAEPRQDSVARSRSSWL